MKKRLLIIVNRLLQGGIDTILIEYLKKIDRQKYTISLAIGTCMEEQETYIHSVPSDISVHYLVKKHFLINYRKQRSIKKVSPFIKTYDEMVLSPMRRIIQQRNLNKLIKKNDIVIDFDSTFYSFLKNCPIPKISFFHFSFRQYHNGNKRKLERLGRKMEVYDKIVTICDAMKEEGIEMYPALKDKFVTIYNAFDTATIAKKAEEPVNSPLINRPYILAVQRLEENQKDLSTLIRAYKILVDKYAIKEDLYVIGEGKSRTDLQNLCQRLNITDRVVFLKKQINPYPWMKHCRTFVLSSKFEGFGIVLIEAMALNCPIVSSDCPTGPEEILAFGKAGALVPIGDEQAMATAIERTLSDTEYREELTSNMKEQIKKFDIQVSILEIQNLVSSLLS